MSWLTACHPGARRQRPAVGVQRAGIDRRVVVTAVPGGDHGAIRPHADRRLADVERGVDLHGRVEGDAGRGESARDCPLRVALELGLRPYEDDRAVGADGDVGGIDRMFTDGEGLHLGDLRRGRRACERDHGETEETRAGRSTHGAPPKLESLALLCRRHAAPQSKNRHLHGRDRHGEVRRDPIEMLPIGLVS